MPSSTPREPQVPFSSPMPPDYRFVRKGDVYMTAQCRKRTHAAGRILYVVVDDSSKKRNKKKRIGLRCPASIVCAVSADRDATAADRAAAVDRRDAAVERDFADALARLFPRAPGEEIPAIAKQTLKKRSRRVGRTGTLALDEKVRLAVRAHIRHRHTEYDALFKRGFGREEAREAVRGEVERVAGLWRGGVVTQKKPAELAIRPREKEKAHHPPAVIVIAEGEGDEAAAGRYANSGGERGPAKTRRRWENRDLARHRNRRGGARGGVLDKSSGSTKSVISGNREDQHRHAEENAAGIRRSLRIAQGPLASFAGMDLEEGGADEEFPDSEEDPDGADYDDDGDGSDWER